MDVDGSLLGSIGLSKAITIIALTCFLVVGAAIASVLSSESLQVSVAEAPAPLTSPVTNRAAKQDRLAVVSLAQASLPPLQASAPSAERNDRANDLLRQAYASAGPADLEAAKAVQALTHVAPQVQVQSQGQPQAQPQAQPQPAAVQPGPPPVQATAPAPAQPKVATKPAPQKSYALLSDAQIAGIKERLKLDPSQESYWPGVETALRKVARRLNAEHLSNPQVKAAQLDPDCQEVQELKSAAMPLLFQLREDQKDEVRKLARVIGLEKVASAI
jgi:hypothetical protein